MRVWFSGKTTVFQTVVGSSILPTRTTSLCINKASRCKHYSFNFNLAETLMTSLKLSSLEILFLPLLPHFWHLWIKDHSPPFSSASIGSISPAQFSDRSPGNTSTCRLQRHLGQWFVNPSPPTPSPQCPQTKSSILLLNFDDIVFTKLGLA